MPQITVKGIKEDDVKVLAKNTSKQLADICSCPSDWFVYDYIPSKFYNDMGEEIVNPVVQVWWFEREQDVQDKVVACLDNEIKNLGYEFSQISFSVFYKSSYYENSEHF